MPWRAAASCTTNTWWPCSTASRTLGGVMPTRYSWTLISFGTPMRIAELQTSKWPASRPPAVRDLDHGKGRVAQKLARLLGYALAMLHRARRVIRNPERRPALGRPHVVGAEKLRHVPRHARELGGPLGILRVARQHVAVVFH